MLGRSRFFHVQSTTKEVPLGDFVPRTIREKYSFQRVESKRSSEWKEPIPPEEKSSTYRAPTAGGRSRER